MKSTPVVNMKPAYLLFSAMAACLWLRETNKHTNKKEFRFSITSEWLNLDGKSLSQRHFAARVTAGSTALTKHLMKQNTFSRTWLGHAEVQRNSGREVAFGRKRDLL